MSGDADIATKRLRLKIALEELREMKDVHTYLLLPKESGMANGWIVYHQDL